MDPHRLDADPDPYHTFHFGVNQMRIRILPQVLHILGIQKKFGMFGRAYRNLMEKVPMA
jgi:hypothetical protein